MRFAMMYSCGKDSALALARMIGAGHTPTSLITTFNEDAGRSWFHGATPDLLDAVSNSLGIPLVTCHCTGKTYEAAVEQCLGDARAKGAEAAVFGDIDIEGHRIWNQDRCRAAGLECVMPLWNEPRETLVDEVVAKGFKAVVKAVDLAHLGMEFLGEELDADLVRRIAATGADVCGENGEYHTFVYDGPVFEHPVLIQLGEKLTLGTHAVVDISLAMSGQLQNIAGEFSA